MTDVHFMKLAIVQGLLALGKTGDNPNVGSVIVKNGEVIGEGHTQPPGADHAEIQALKAAESLGHSVKGATLYCTLEPCTFFGRTPPCVREIIAKELSCVVIGIRDPHPRVNGLGVTLLKEAGIDVVEGVAELEVRQSLQSWLRQYQTN